MRWRLIALDGFDGPNFGWLSPASPCSDSPLAICEPRWAAKRGAAGSPFSAALGGRCFERFSRFNRRFIRNCTVCCRWPRPQAVPVAAHLCRLGSVPVQAHLGRRGFPYRLTFACRHRPSPGDSKARMPWHPVMRGPQRSGTWPAAAASQPAISKPDRLRRCFAAGSQGCPRASSPIGRNGPPCKLTVRVFCVPVQAHLCTSFTWPVQMLAGSRATARPVAHCIDGSVNPQLRDGSTRGGAQAINEGVFRLEVCRTGNHGGKP